MFAADDQFGIKKKVAHVWEQADQTHGSELKFHVPVIKLIWSHMNVAINGELMSSNRKSVLLYTY